MPAQSSVNRHLFANSLLGGACAFYLALVPWMTIRLSWDSVFVFQSAITVVFTIVLALAHVTRRRCGRVVDLRHIWATSALALALGSSGALEAAAWLSQYASRGYRFVPNKYVFALISTLWRPLVYISPSLLVFVARRIAAPASRDRHSGVGEVMTSPAAFSLAVRTHLLVMGILVLSAFMVEFPFEPWNSILGPILVRESHVFVAKMTCLSALVLTLGISLLVLSWSLRHTPADRVRQVSSVILRLVLLCFLVVTVLCTVTFLEHSTYAVRQRPWMSILPPILSLLPAVSGSFTLRFAICHPPADSLGAHDGATACQECGHDLRGT